MKDKLFRFFVLPIVGTAIGVIAIPYFAFGGHKGDHSGDGSLPFTLGLLGLVVGVLGSLFFGTLAVLHGINPVIAYSLAYYLTFGACALTIMD